MKYLNYLGLLGVICLFLLQNVYPWLPPNGMDLFEAVDLNNDGIVTPEESFTSPNKAVVQQWEAFLQKNQHVVVKGGITRKKFQELSKGDAGGTIIELPWNCHLHLDIIV